MSAITVPTCVVCGSHGGDPILGSNFGAEKVALLRCRSCQVVFLREWPRYLDVEIYDYYDARAEWPRERLYDELTGSRLTEVLARLAPSAPSRTLLDVGCGEGQMVAVAADAGWEARGIDVAAGAIDICKRFSLDCTTTDFFDPSLDDRRFGVITMVELVEHVPEPERFLQRSEALLEAGGLVYITTPNFDGLSRRVLGGEWRAISPDHVSYFTPSTLIRRVRAATALEIVSVETRNTSPAALRGALRRLARRPAAARKAAAGAGAVVAEEQAVRRRIEASVGLRAAKRLLNAALRRASMGDTLELVLRLRA